MRNFVVAKSAHSLLTRYLKNPTDDALGIWLANITRPTSVSFDNFSHYDAMCISAYCCHQFFSQAIKRQI